LIALDEMKRNPHTGFTMKEVAQELTVELGRKIQNPKPIFHLTH
jgi:hypothetical protein